MIGNTHLRCAIGGTQPAGPEEERDHDRRHGDGVHELREKEYGEAKRGVLGVKTPTSSLSASTTSKGGRLSSAVMAMRKIAKGTKPKRIRFQCQMPPPWRARCCAW